MSESPKEVATNLLSALTKLGDALDQFTSSMLTQSEATIKVQMAGLRAATDEVKSCRVQLAQPAGQSKVFVERAVEVARIWQDFKGASREPMVFALRKPWNERSVTELVLELNLMVAAARLDPEGDES